MPAPHLSHTAVAFDSEYVPAGHVKHTPVPFPAKNPPTPHDLGHRGLTDTETDTFNDKQSQIAERKTGDGRGPGDHSREAG